MKCIFMLTVLTSLLVFIGCGEDPSGPGKDPTASVLQVELTGEMNCNSRGRVSLQLTRQNSDILGQESSLELQGTCLVTANWSICPDTDFISYVLYRSTSPGISEHPEEAQVLCFYTDRDDRTFVDDSLNSETHYYFVLRTANEAGNYAWSNECDLITPDQSEIDVTEPGSSTIWEVGQSNTLVEWVGSGAQVKLEVWYAGEYVADFSGWIPNAGSYTRSAPIPATWGIGLNFRIRVLDSDNPPGYGFSEEFQIYDDIEVTQPDLTTIWIWGQEGVTVEWNEPYSDSVYISVYKGGSSIGTFSDWVPNTGSYTRDTPIPSAWGTGEDYTVKVIGSLGSEGISDVFSIMTMNIIEPDSSTEWTHCQTNTQVLWAPGPGSNVRMEIWQGGTKRDNYCGWTPDDGEYTRTEAIPEAWGTGNDFQIKMIDDLNNAAWSSEFTIIESWPDSVVATVSVGDAPNAICSLPSGEYVYVSNQLDNTISVIRTSDNTVVATVSVGSGPHGVCSVPSGEYVYVANRNNDTVSVIRTSDNTVVATVNVGTNPNDVCSLPSGEYVYVGCLGSVYVIRTSDNTVVATVEVSGVTSAICSLPSGEYVYVTNGSEDSVYVIRTSDNTLVSTVDVDDYPNGICSLPSGEYVYVTSGSYSTVSVIRASDNTVVSTIEVGTQPYAICSLSSGQYVYVTNSSNPVVTVIRTSDNTVVATVGVGSNSWGVCSLPSGEYVYVTSSWDNTVSVIH
ncbi:MAG: YncE family protein [Candidatus Sabulitectum sp.]|nr:YncE family protein [Candidatus Sabulitectum sp.]